MAAAKGTSPAHATQTFLQDLGQLDNIESILAFDVYHAFDSPPKALICQVMGRLGTRVRLLQLIAQALEHGTTYIRGSQSYPFSTTHGVKQGCPLSCLLFVIVFDIPLRHLTAQGITFSAYVDDIAAPARVNCSQQVADAVQKALSMIGCQINLSPRKLHPVLRAERAEKDRFATGQRNYFLGCLMNVILDVVKKIAFLVLCNSVFLNVRFFTFL